MSSHSHCHCLCLLGWSAQLLITLGKCFNSLKVFSKWSCHCRCLLVGHLSYPGSLFQGVFKWSFLRSTRLIKERCALPLAKNQNEFYSTCSGQGRKKQDELANSFHYRNAERFVITLTTAWVITSPCSAFWSWDTFEKLSSSTEPYTVYDSVFRNP